MDANEKRKLLVEKLVVSGHLNVPERLDLGSQTIQWSEAVAVVSRVLNDTGFFPKDARPWKEGESVHEGAILRKLPTGRAEVIQQRSDARNPMQLAEQKVTAFTDVNAAIQFFVSKEWPTGIDGIQIVWRDAQSPRLQWQVEMHLNEGYTKLIGPGGLRLDIPTECIPAQFRPMGSRFYLTIVWPQFPTGATVKESRETRSQYIIEPLNE